MSIMTTVRNESSGCTGHAFLADDVEGERNIRKRDSIFFLLFILFSSSLPVQVVGTDRATGS